MSSKAVSFAGTTEEEEGELPTHLRRFVNPFPGSIDLQRDLPKQVWAVNWRDAPTHKNVLPCGPIVGFFNTVSDAGQEIQCPTSVFLNAPLVCSKGV